MSTYNGEQDDNKEMFITMPIDANTQITKMARLKHLVFACIAEKN